MAQTFLLIAAGVVILLLGLAGLSVLVRLSAVLRALEEAIATTTEEMRETLPEVREGLGNVNDIAAGVNVALRVTGSGAERLGDQAGTVVRRLRWNLRAALYGARVAAGSYAAACAERERLKEDVAGER
jgi:hypothetical protein